jgi:WD40 repeat protein
MEKSFMVPTADTRSADAPAAAPRVTVLSDEASPAALAWSPDGATLAIAGAFNLRNYPRLRITLWDVKSGARLGGLANERGVGTSGTSLAFTADGKSLIAPITNSAAEHQHVAMTVWDVASGSITRQIPGPLPDKPIGYNNGQSLALSPDGTVLAISVYPLDHLCALYDTAHWGLIGLLRVDEVMPQMLAFSPDGSVLAIAGQGSSIVLFDPATRRRLRVIEAFGDTTSKAAPSVAALAFSPDGKMIAAGADDYPHRAPLRDPADPETATAAMGPIRIWRVADGALVRAYTGAFGDIRGLSWSPRVPGLLVSASSDSTLRFWDVSDPKDAATLGIPLRSPPTQATFSPDGARIAVSDPSAVLIIPVPPR